VGLKCVKLDPGKSNVWKVWLQAVKMKVTLYHAMKAQRRNKGIALLFL